MKRENNSVSVVAVLVAGFIQVASGVSIRSPNNQTNAVRLADPVAVDGAPGNITSPNYVMNWIALGDSYTAGPGLGDPWDGNKACIRNVGSYAPQLYHDFPPIAGYNSLWFAACTGYTTDQARQYTIPDLPNDWADFMVMTLGGNDIGFGRIARHCLIAALDWDTSPCDDALQDARDIINSAYFWYNMQYAYDEIFAKMRDENRYKLYHIWYPRLFNAETEWCNKVRIIRTGPKLLWNYRQALNDLVDALNSKLNAIAYNYTQEHSTLPSWRDGSRLVTISPDNFVYNGDLYILYEGHRFCEPDQSLDQAWFFSTFEHPPPVHWTEWVKQTFHPKIPGMFRIKWALSLELQRTQKPLAKNISIAVGKSTGSYPFRGRQTPSVQKS